MMLLAYLMIIDLNQINSLLSNFYNILSLQSLFLLMLQANQQNISALSNQESKPSTFITDHVDQDLLGQLSLVIDREENIENEGQDHHEVHVYESPSCKLNHQAIDKICLEIETNKISISAYKKPTPNLIINGDSINKQYQSIDIQRDQILKKKDKILEQLRNIELLEYDLKKRPNNKQNQRKKQRVEPALNKDLVKTLKIKRKIYQNQLQSKLDECKEKQFQDKIMSEEMQEQNREERKRMRKQMAEKSMQHMKIRKRQLKENLYKTEDFYKKLKEKKPKFIDSEQIQKKLKEELQLKYRKALFEMRAQKSINLHELKGHQAEYLKARIMHEQEKAKKPINSQMFDSQKHKSIFLQNVLKEQKQQQALEAQKWNTVIQNVQKNYIYSQKVRQQAKKHLKVKPSEDKKEEVHQFQFNRSKMIQQGNQYLKLARSIVNLNPSKKQNSQAKESDNRNSSVRYINYLKEQSFKRKEISSSEKIKRYLKQGHIDLALKAAGQSQTSLYKSMKAKLRLLEQIDGQRQN